MFYGKNFQEIQNINSKNILPIGITENLKLIYTDSAKVKAILYSDLNKDFTNQSFPYSEFPEGVKITFYDNIKGKSFWPIKRL